MAQLDLSPPPDYVRDVLDALDHPFGLTLPEPVFDAAVRRAFAAGLAPAEAAIRLCHEHGWQVSRHWLEAGEMASDLAEFVIASRIDESARLAREQGRDLVELLPDLAEFVEQPCFSDELRGMVANILTWHGLSEHLWGAPGVEPARERRPSA